MNILIKVTRRGFCDRNKCKAACCRALNLASGNFANDCGITPSEMTIFFTQYRCTNINESSAGRDCRIYKNRPTLCKEFPTSLWDLIYHKVKDVCSYWFEIEIKELPDPSPVDSQSPSAIPSPSPVIEITSDPTINTNSGR